MDPADLARRARAVRNRGRCHVFLGDPWSDDADKTTVEPGNGSSPGAWTCGVALWALSGEEAATPDLIDDAAIAWELAPPVLSSTWRGVGLRIVHRTVHLGGPGSEGVDHHAIEAVAERDVDAELALVVRDVGPAGGAIGDLRWDADGATLAIDGDRRVVCETPPRACDLVAADGAGSPLAALRFPARLRAGERLALAVRVEHGFGARACAALLRRATPAVAPVAAAFAAAGQRWRAALPARLHAPDPRVARGWEQCAFHLLAAMECGLPRIGALNYPALWLRDGVIVVRALDLIGRHDLARVGCDHLAPTVFCGGFGAESDAPGEGAWALARHGLTTRDDAWLAARWPAIAERVDWIRRMLGATAPLRAVGHDRMPRYLAHPAINVVCFAAVDGCIHGRMDWHDPDFYVNAWAVAGLRAAAAVAARLGRGDAAPLAREADALEAAIARRLLPRYGNERDPACAPWPTGALARAPGLRDAFAAWWRANRVDAGGARRGEPLWTYFEAAQAHNALLLGLREEAWVSLAGMLAPDGAWDVGAYGEGAPGSGEFLPFGNGGDARGWLDPATARAGNMPHNWTTAELIACLRDVFVVEDGDTLVLGRGVPRAWLTPGSEFGCDALPTDRGPVTWRARVRADRSLELTYDGPPGQRFDLPS